MSKELLKGNYAVIKGALLAGCVAYFGYPITPASEIAEAAAYYFPLAGRTFVQAESEIASINMVYGAAGAGVRCMTASSGPGISLKQEGISYIAGSELPCVIVDVMRGGPGLGNIAPEQGDYHQVVKGGGHGNYKCAVYAPNSAQEMCDLTYKAFETAEKYRNPVFVLADGFIGQMMEQVEFGKLDPVTPKKLDWGVHGTADSKNLINSIYLDPDELEAHNRKLQEKYKKMEENEAMFETYKTEDADIVLIGYGITSRILRTVVDEARKAGIKAGLFRPITLWPLAKDELNKLKNSAKKFFVVEMSNGQLVEDIRLVVEGKIPVEFHGRMGGNVPTVDEVLEITKKLS